MTSSRLLGPRPQPPSPGALSIFSMSSPLSLPAGNPCDSRLNSAHIQIPAPVSKLPCWMLLHENPPKQIPLLGSQLCGAAISFPLFYSPLSLQCLEE